jgi:non-specific serine/threonine protein kinase
MKNKNKVVQEMTPEFHNTCRRDPEWSYVVSVTLSLADIKKDAMDWLDNAVTKGFFNYPLLQKDPFLDNIRNEDRFKKLMEQVKYKWEHFQV